MSSQRQISRALAGKFPTDNYDIGYIQRLRGLSACPKHRIIPAFSGYCTNLKFFAECKFFSNATDVVALATRLSKYEREMQA